jgi:hypothetical protein
MSCSFDRSRIWFRQDAEPVAHALVRRPDRNRRTDHFYLTLLFGKAAEARTGETAAAPAHVRHRRPCRHAARILPDVVSVRSPCDARRTAVAPNLHIPMLQHGSLAPPFGCASRRQGRRTRLASMAAIPGLQVGQPGHSGFMVPSAIEACGQVRGCGGRVAGTSRRGSVDATAGRIVRRRAMVAA